MVCSSTAQGKNANSFRSLYGIPSAKLAVADEVVKTDQTVATAVVAAANLSPSPTDPNTNNRQKGSGRNKGRNRT